MPRPRWADEADDDRYGDDDDADDTISCPYCRKPVHEDSQR